MSVLTIGAVNLKRLIRDRVALFFVFVFPVILILLLGVTFGGSFTPKVGVLAQSDGPLAQALVQELRASEAFDVETYDHRSSLGDAVERGLLEAGVMIPNDYDQVLRQGGDVEVEYLAKPGDFSAALTTAVGEAVTAHGAHVRAARLAVDQGRTSFQDAYVRASVVGGQLPGVEVAYQVAGGELEDEEEFGQFDSGASTQLVLFMFVNSLAGSAALIQTRQYGVLRRMLATPTHAASVLLGETLGRFLVAMVQGVFIVALAGLIFGVDWGDPLGVAAIIGLFALVSTGAAMLFGSILSNEQQAGALVPFGLALAALGGSMVPLEVFPDTMKAIAHITPHAWANEAFEELIGAGAGVGDVLQQVAALAGFAVVLLSVASWRLRVALLRS